jgi:VIT1/CCC1 family predicted Fe2+/Mn2+ transporter
MSETASERNRLIETHNAASESYDRGIMTLSGGSLGLSLAFIKDIAPHPVRVWAIQSSWGLMVASLVFVIGSHALSVEVHRRIIECIDGNRTYADEPWWVKTGVTRMNVLSGTLFLLGAAFLVYFASANI